MRCSGTTAMGAMLTFYLDWQGAIKSMKVHVVIKILLEFLEEPQRPGQSPGHLIIVYPPKFLPSSAA